VVGTTFSANFPTANPLQNGAGGNGDVFILKLRPAVDISLTMTDSPDPIALGSNLTYTISVKNVGDLSATGVSLNDALPAGATFVSATSSQGTCSGTGPVTCSVGNLSSGASATITIVIKPPAVKTITNTASASCSETDSNPSNNTATESTQVSFADPSVSIATAYGKVAPGARIIYLLAVKNNSGSAADSVTLTDNLPSDTTFVSCSASGGVCGGSGNNRSVTFSSLAVGQSATVVLVATVNNSVAEGTIISNTATVTSSTVDSDPGNNSTTATVIVTATPLRQKTNGKITFSTGRIYIVKADGSETATPFPGIPDAILPAWSPDGTKMAFMVSKFRPTYPNDMYAEIDVVNADGTGLIAVADNSTEAGFDTFSRFDWSPDGTRIVYVGKDRTIYIANADGTGFSKLPNSPSQVRDLDWSPDGNRFLFSQLGDIYVMNVDGSGLTKLIGVGTGPDGSTSNYAPSWSPDMSRILFNQRSNNYSDVFIMNGDGTGVRRLLNNQPTNAPAWSPDGTKLAFYQGTEVHVINLDGTEDIKLAMNQGCCNYGTINWQPIPTNSPLPPPPPPTQTYSISGRVTNSNNGGISSTTMILSGTRNATLFPDFNGNYLFSNLPAGGNYTVTSSSVAFNFSPQSRTFNNLSADQTGADFVGTYIPVSISGHVKDANGNPLANVLMETRGGFPEGNTNTDSNGYYVFPNLQRGRTYFVYVRQGAGAYTFTPDSVSLANLNSDQTADFVGTKQQSNKIGGRVTNSDAPGVGLSGVQVVLVRGINQAAIVFTDANGNFTFGDQQSGYDYWVSIFDQSGYVFTPRTIYLKNLNTDQQQVNFVRYSFSSYGSINGKVVDSQGNPVDGVTIELSGAANNITGTGSAGTYSFVNIPAGFNYILTPSKAGYIFTPTQRALNNLGSNEQQANFTATPAPLLQLSAASYTTGEASGHVDITINRTGDTSGAASITYATSDTAGLTNCNVINGIASSRCDYATSVGTIRFAIGEASKVISIPVVDDNFTEGSESFTLTLSNPVGATLGAISTSTITITDNASTAGNPIDGVPFFVRQNYIDFLGREPDSFGNTGWQAMLNNCAAGDASCDRIEVSSRFFRSTEFQERGYYVYRFYSASLGRKPNYEEFIPDVAKVSGFLTDAEKEANKVAFVDEFMQRPEFRNKYDLQTTPAAYVDALLTTAGLPTHPSRAGWIAGLTNGSLTRAQVLRQLAESGELSNKYNVEAFVVMQYFGYLRRNPDKFYLDWIAIMNQDPANYRNMVNGFMNSAEYRARFGQ
jgi:uncharacterized repeat protein (TIGR01451 family)